MRQVIQPVDMLETKQEQKNERPNERMNERKRVRHSFDIYQDQLLSLKEIAIDREQAQGKRVLLGDLVQEALDKLIASERTNVRTNE
jgi:hypothetical protein